MTRESQDYLGMKQWESDGRGLRQRQTPKGNTKSELIVKIHWSVLRRVARQADRESECWWNEEKLVKSPSASKSGKGIAGKQGKGNSKKEKVIGRNVSLRRVNCVDSLNTHTA